MPNKEATQKTPAQQLTGKELPGGWKVENLITQTAGQTGGHFSTSYIVRNGNKKAFLKAMDYAKAFSELDPAMFLEPMTAAYNFERDTLKKCESLSRIVTVLDDGKIKIQENDPYSIVQYLIFELAQEGDVRSYMKFGKAFDEAWSLRIIHSAAVALRQLHSVEIAHQDLKPSNMVIFEGGYSKLADLGRASDRNKPSPHDDLKLAGDRTYAPPELLYDHIDPDWNRRRLGCDMYLLGSFVVFFYFGGVSMTHLLLNRLHTKYRPPKLNGIYTGSYNDVLTYIQHYFTQIIREIHGLESEYSEEIASSVKQLCNPDPEKRGHPIDIRRRHNPYNLERYISIFNRLASKAESSLTQRRK